MRHYDGWSFCILGLLLLQAAVLVMLILLLHGVHAQAAGGRATDKFKYYQSITIENADTLDSLVQKYADPEYYKSETAYLQEVISINHLQTVDGQISNCTPGTRLVIPYYSEEFHG